MTSPPIFFFNMYIISSKTNLVSGTCPNNIEGENQVQHFDDKMLILR